MYGGYNLACPETVTVTVAMTMTITKVLVKVINRKCRSARRLSESRDQPSARSCAMASVAFVAAGVSVPAPYAPPAPPGFGFAKCAVSANSSTVTSAAGSATVPAPLAMP